MNYLILSHHKPPMNKDLALWWAPFKKGYTIDLDKAGRYTAAEAEEICRGSGSRMVPVTDAVRLQRRVVIFGDIPIGLRPKREP